ncbi:MAG: MmgE/PrpD family protein [Deltaproteobacteria bacterium]|nr:MmgE/PrpD family protein [Deltaproteobacteria bacterium]
MTTVAARLGRFVERASFEDLSQPAREALKIRVLDSLGCAIGALGAQPVRAVRGHIDDFARSGPSTLIGGGTASPDLAALHNGALVRYLDFNDSYLAPGESCHPSDNLGAVLAAAELRGTTGRDLMTALAVSYQVQCRLSDAAPVRARGFDHTVQGAYGAAAGVAKALGLDAQRTAHALAIAGASLNGLRVTRTGRLSHWKGLAAPFAAAGATQAAFLAMRGVTGPLEVFEGKKGFFETIAGPAHIAWEDEDLERVRGTALKRYNAEVHAQSAVEGLLELRARHGLLPDEVASIELDTFAVAFHIIGGGEEGDKTRVATKEEADHSLPYMLAAAMLDGKLTPEQYVPERIARDDVQALLRRVRVTMHDAYSARFPAEVPCRVSVVRRDGSTVSLEKRDYLGYPTRPMPWSEVFEKFRLTANDRADDALLAGIAGVVEGLEDAPLSRLTGLLGRAGAVPGWHIDERRSPS